MMIFKLFLFTTTLSLFWYYYQTASVVNFISIAIKAIVCFVVPVQMYFGWRRQYRFEHLRAPFSLCGLKSWLTILNRWAFVLIVGWAGKLAMGQWNYVEAAYHREQVFYLLLLGILVLASAFVRVKVDRLFNLLLLIFSCTLGLEVYRAQTPPALSESVVVQSPYEQSFYIVDGGSSRLTSTMKVGGRSNRRYAIYMIGTEHAYQPERPMENGYLGNFGLNLLAPADGTIVQVVDTVEDSGPDFYSRDSGPGNYVLVRIREDQFLMLAHLKQGSVRVKVGDWVQSGQVIAQAGKSGSVTLSATFMAVYAREDIFDPNNWSYPIYFEGVRQWDASGKNEPFFAVRNDMFSPLKP